eukprot:3295656-Pleurochrysis_carterae.AAC.1
MAAAISSAALDASITGQASALPATVPSTESASSTFPAVQCLDHAVRFACGKEAARDRVTRSACHVTSDAASAPKLG